MTKNTDKAKASAPETRKCNRCGVEKPLNQIYAGGNCWSCNQPDVFKKREADRETFIAAVKAGASAPQAQHSPLPWHVELTRHISYRREEPNGNVEIGGVASCERRGEYGAADARLIVASVNHAAQLAEALRDTELRTTQARIASGIGKRKNQTEFLLGELERIAGAARQALAAYEEAKAPTLDETLHANIQDGNVEDVEDAIDEAMSQ